jgi:heme/copper-type cytochrome/quinol oxidase subunit 2
MLVLGVFLLFGMVLLVPTELLAQTCPTGFSPENGTCWPNNTGLSETKVDVILKNVMNWLLAIVGIIAIIAFTISGVQYLTSAGDDSQIETAKRNMKYSIVGVIVALSGYIILLTINSLLA